MLFSSPRRLDRMLTAVRHALGRGKHFLVTAAIRVGAPSADEQVSIDRLRDTVRAMPPMELETSGAASEWAQNRAALRQAVLKRDPRKFLRWPVVTKTMYVLDAPYVYEELHGLQADGHWPDRWAPALREDAAGTPIPHREYPASSGNLIHHCHHVFRFERSTGLSIEDFSQIVEFGGGYGSMCRLVHRLGFRGRYIIVDFPEFSALQRFFLDSVGVSRPGFDVRLVSSLDDLPAHVESDLRPSLFLSTWALSEASEEVREQVLKVVKGFDAYLLAYQMQFHEVDNREYFGNLKADLASVTWQDVPAPSSAEASDAYLFGAR